MIMKCIIMSRTALVFVCLVTLSPGCIPGSISKEEQKFLSCPDELRGVLPVEGLVETREGYRDRDYYLALTLHQQLLLAIRNDERVAIRGSYRWKKGEHDLERVSGRAAWMLESLLGVEFPKIEPDSGQDQIGQIFAAAKKAVDAHRQKVLAKHYQAEKRSLAELKAAYQGKIVSGKVMKLEHPSVAELKNLFVEWVPIGKKLADLEAVIGAPAAPKKKSRQVYSYSFQSLGEDIFMFFCEDGVIKHVRMPRTM